MSAEPVDGGYYWAYYQLKDGGDYKRPDIVFWVAEIGMWVACDDGDPEPRRRYRVIAGPIEPPPPR